MYLCRRIKLQNLLNMKPEEKEFDINEVAITLKIDNEVLDKVRTGEITIIRVEINEETQSGLLELVDGKPVFDVEGAPNKNYGCYFYNDGEFPYVIRRSLSFLVLLGDEGGCLSRIIDIDTEPGTRFNYQGLGKPIEDDPNGDSCKWVMCLEIVPLPQNAKTYLMRWNPSISSFTEKDYEECIADMIHGMFRLNWSISEWQEARRGDLFYMMRVGDDKAGIIFNGQFVSDPYPDDDWAGTTKRRMYVDMVCVNAAEPGESPLVSLQKLQTEIPEYDWAKGHSGALLTDEVSAKLTELFKEDS